MPGWKERKSHGDYRTPVPRTTGQQTGGGTAWTTGVSFKKKEWEGQFSDRRLAKKVLQWHGRHLIRKQKREIDKKVNIMTRTGRKRTGLPFMMLERKRNTKQEKIQPGVGFL